MTTLTQLKKWFDDRRDEIQKDYFHFLRFKSIAADPAFANETKKCAEWLCHYIQGELIPTETFPLVYKEDLRAGPDAPTVLIYGHYDVQPVDPLDLWESDPFEPTIRNHSVFARGAVDDKGQIFYAILAMKAWKSLGRELPINVKFCIEGEEESSSKGLKNALPKLKEKLRADSLLIVDFDQYDRETPAISLGARGLVALEVHLIGSNGDLHSGMHGGIAYNPNRALVEILSKLWDENGRVQVKGFYDDVLEMSAEERKEFAFSHTKESYTKEFGLECFGGEKGRSLAEANGFRPTLEINGIGGGYFGKGFKTVIPAQAIAKISCRLVPNQDPNKIAKHLSEFLHQHAPAGMKVKVELMGGEPAFRASANSSLAKAVSIAAEEVTGRACKKLCSGGSIPVIGVMMGILNADVVGMGYGLPTDQIHAPNEHFDLNRLEKWFLTVARTLELL